MQRALVEWLGNPRQFPKRVGKQAGVVVARGGHHRNIAAEELRQDIEHLPAAQVDIEQRAVKVLSLDSEQDVLEVRQGADHLAAESLQHGLDVERDQALVFGKED